MHLTEGHPVSPTMNQHGAVVPSSRLDARAFQVPMVICYFEWAYQGVFSAV